MSLPCRRFSWETVGACLTVLCYEPVSRSPEGQGPYTGSSRFLLCDVKKYFRVWNAFVNNSLRNGTIFSKTITCVVLQQMLSFRRNEHEKGIV